VRATGRSPLQKHDLRTAKAPPAFDSTKRLRLCELGAYFVTIVTRGRACLFGEIVNAETRLNDAGSAIERWWFEMNNKFRTVETDDFVIMPNHFHGIVVIADVGADLCVGPVGRGAHIGAPLHARAYRPLCNGLKR
jgi:hypothetical protein